VKSKEEQNISRTDAIFEVYADYIVERNDKNVNKALLWIFTINSSQISEFCVCCYVLVLASLLFYYICQVHVYIS